MAKLIDALKTRRLLGLTLIVGAVLVVGLSCGSTSIDRTTTEAASADSDAAPAEAEPATATSVSAPTPTAASEPAADPTEPPAPTPEPQATEPEDTEAQDAEEGEHEEDAAEAAASEHTLPVFYTDRDQGPDVPTDAATESLYSEVVGPLIENSCMSCHQVGGPGSSHLELDTAQDVVDVAQWIASVTTTKYMPPWPASDLSVSFVGDYSLNDDEIAAIKRWADAGAPLDVPADTPLVSSRIAGFIEDPDMVLTSEKGPYKGSTDRADDYRCLIFDPKLASTEWVLASHFEADQLDVAHHAIISLASEELRAQAEERDAADDGPGWTCYGVSNFDTSAGGYQYRFGGWAPGGQPARAPSGYATPMHAGDFLIVQMHYHYDNNDSPPDLSRMTLDFASDEELAEAGGEFKTLTSERYLGPAEIPCYAGDTNPLCDRAAALQRVTKLYGRFGAALPNYFLGQCGAQVSDFADMTDGTAWSTCDLPVRNPGRIVALTGHMHELGLSIRLTLNPDTPGETILLDIPDWDFEWQFGFRPFDDIIITTDDIIRVDCAWNRERAPYDAVGYILWAEGTGDEMCYSSVVTAPVAS